jgi:uncharacterized protein
MRSRNKLLVLIVAAVVLFLNAAVVSAEVAVPDRPFNHVVDLAGIIDANMEDGLNRYLLELEQKTTAQMVILTINSLEGESIDDLSLSIAHDKWKLGQKDKENGALLLVSLQDRKYRFEIGYGLEGVIPDSLAGSIGRQYLVPYFKKGDYSTGITAAAIAMINEVAADAGVAITGMPKLRGRSSNQNGSAQRREPTLLGTIFSVLFFIGLIYLFIKHPRLLMLFFMMSMMGGGRRSGWSGGGGFGGGSFGGGGGGGFGGGGAGGGW